MRSLLATIVFIGLGLGSDLEGNKFSFKQWRDGCSNWRYFSLSFRSSLAYSASPGSQPPLPESLRCFSSSLSLSLWSCLSSGSWWARQSFRHFGAKPDKKICRRSGGEAEFMEDASHGRLDGMVVEIDRFWVVCAARGAQWLSGSEQGFDGFVAQDEERCHRPEAGQQRLVARVRALRRMICLPRSFFRS